MFSPLRLTYHARIMNKTLRPMTGSGYRALAPCILVLALCVGSCGSDSTKKKVNDYCGANSDCADGICHRSVCASSRPASNGASCSGIGMCKSFACHNGKCVAGNLGGGRACLHDDECGSRKCEGGFCTHEADGGTPDIGMPDQGLVDQATPEAGGPDLRLPDSAPPDAPTPDQQVPDAALPDGEVPDLLPPDLGCLGCDIAFKCVADGTVNPQDSCYRCDVTRSKTSWTMFDGKGCVFTVAGGAKGHQDGDGLQAKFGWPAGLHVKSGKLYITTQGGASEQVTRVRVMDLKTHKVSTLAGMGNAGFAEGAALTHAKFKSPMGIVVDNAGVVYVADKSNSRIRAIKNGLVATIAGDGNTGTASNSLLTSNLTEPFGLTIDAAGDLYVTTGNGSVASEIRKLDMKKGTVTSLYQVSTLNHFFTGIDVDGKGKAFFFHYEAYTSGGRWLRDLDLSKKVSAVLAGQKQGCVTGTTATAQFTKIQDLAVGSAGEVYMPGHDCYQLLRVSGGLVAGVAGTGKSGSADGPALKASFGKSPAIAVDPATGKVYIGDAGPLSYWHKIRVYTP